MVWHQPDLPIFDPTEPRIMPQDSRAFFTLNWLSPAGRLNRHQAFQLDEMETVLKLTAGQPNLYMSQCVFDRPVRRSAFVKFATHAYVDLDIYCRPDLAALSPSGAVHAVLAHCRDTGTPPPSAIISSGRGLYGKWYFPSPIGREKVGLLMGVNRALVRRFDRFGADPKATDAARVLRITGSEHSGAGRMVELLHLEQPGGRTITYDFDAFARQLAPSTDAAPGGGLLAASVADLDREARTQRGGRMFTREGWHWTIVEDVRSLAGMRWGGTVPPGWRDTFGHVIACQLARIFHPATLYREIVAHVGLILPADYVARELRSDCTTLMDRARRAEPYRHRKTTLIDKLRITPGEQRHMRALISEAEGKRRAADRQRAERRADGIRDRAAYEASATEREQPWRAAGISRATWYRRRSD